VSSQHKGVVEAFLLEARKESWCIAGGLQRQHDLAVHHDRDGSKGVEPLSLLARRRTSAEANLHTPGQWVLVRREQRAGQHADALIVPVIDKPRRVALPDLGEEMCCQEIIDDSVEHIGIKVGESAPERV
jgi:hypothetical protein